MSFGDGVTGFYDRGGSGNPVFYNCTNLQHVAVGRGVTAVPSYLFSGVGNSSDKLAVSFAAPITSIGTGAFNNGNITNLDIRLSKCNVAGYAFQGCPAVNERNIDFSQIVSIGNYQAFAWCGNIRGAIDLSSATGIGDSAFNGCTGITSVKTSASLTYLGSQAFYNCTALVDANIDGTNLSLKNVTSLFSGCINLRRVSFGDGVTGFYDRGGSVNPVFYNCTNLQHVAVGRGVTAVPSYLFSGVGNSSDKLAVSFAAPITSIGTGAFNNGNITNLDIRLSKCSVAGYAFQGCPAVNVRNIDFSQIVSIGNYQAFAWCGNIRGEVDLSNATGIGDSTFNGCTGITSVKLGSATTYIGSSAFYNASNVEKFSFSGVPPRGGNNAFKNVKSGAVGTYTAEHAAEWEAVIDSKGYWNGLKMKPSYYTVIYDANNGTGVRTTATVEWGEPTPAGDGTFTWEAHYFMGWAFEDIGGSTLGSNDVIPEPQEGNTVTLYGQWATFEPVAADWSSGSITLKATGVAAKEGELVWLSFCDANAGDANWEYVDNSTPTSSDGGQSISVTDTEFSSRLCGIPPVKYRFQIGKSLDEVRVTMSCTTRTKRGIFVGVGEYGPAYSGLKELENAPKAVDKLKKLMVDNGDVDENDIIIKKNSEATYAAVCNAFATVAEKTRNNPGDICIVYIATHGGSNGADGKIGSLCLYDKPPKSVDPDGIGYHDKLFEKHICSLDPQNKGVAVICILSACHSGAFFESNNNNKECVPIESWCHSEGVGNNVAWVVASDAASESYDVFGYKFLLQYGWSEGWAWNKAHKMDDANAGTTSTILFSDLAYYAQDMFQSIADCCGISGAKIDDSSSILNKITAGRSVKLNSALERPGRPKDLSASKGISDKVKVEWTQGAGGDPEFYYVIRKFKETSKLEAMISTEDTFIEESEIASQAYPMQYAVVAVNGAGSATTEEYEEGWCAINVYKATLFYNLPKGYTIEPNNKMIFVKEGDSLDAELRTVTETIRGWSLGSYEFKGWKSTEGSWYIPNVAVDGDLAYHAVWSTDQTYGMTQDWLGSHRRISTTSEGDITVAAAMTAANGCRTVAECYALGIDPEDPNDDLKITDFKMEDGKPLITLNHTKDGSGNSFESRIKTLGKAYLTDADWVDVTDKDQSAYRFFKVTVDMP